MANTDTVVSGSGLSFMYTMTKPVLRDADFSVRRGAKVALMGQNGAGKSTLFALVTGEAVPDKGQIHRAPRLSIAVSRQVIPRADREKTVREFFAACFDHVVYDIDPKIAAVLEIVHLTAPLDAPVGRFSGGQQARLLLASALIRDPDILLLDEPTNNLDAEGIVRLTQFLVDFKKTCIVISHDAAFLNAFTTGVLYIDIHTHTLEQYDGTYHDVVEEIAARIDREQKKNAQLVKSVAAKKEQANKFANKSGSKIRHVAKQLREKAEALEEELVDVRKEDKTIRRFEIPVQEGLSGTIVHIEGYDVIKKGEKQLRPANIKLKRHDRLLLSGPNGIGKSTFLESLAERTAQAATVHDGIRIGYYRQDFSLLDHDATVRETLDAAMDERDEERLRSVAAGFLLDANLIDARVAMLSEGQKGLLSFARLVLQRPGVLLLDEPTNHINFRHLPVLARAIEAYRGPMVLVSHMPEFVEQIRIDEVLTFG